MRQNLHPSELEPKLKHEYLDVLFTNVLEAAYRAREDASTEDDTNWTMGTLPYGRVHGRFKRLHRDCSLPWLKLCNSTMDYTIAVDGVLMQVVMDDPDVRRKGHRLLANKVELCHQASLLGPAVDNNITWRLYVDSVESIEGHRLVASILGFDTNRNVVCHWVHDHVPLNTARILELPAEVDIPEQFPIRRDKDIDQNAPKNADSVDE